MWALWMLLVACGRSKDDCGSRRVPLEDNPGGHLILITLDTTRADALGVYGGPKDATPNLDRLAAEGVRFEWALSHVPTTLSSHTSMFTGLDPYGHRVPKNGFHLPPELPTVATRLQDAGWDTLAVIGATAVASETSINRGFRLFDEELDIRFKDKRHEARGDDVTRRALCLAEQAQPGKSAFLWVHYYDAHSPYLPPDEHAAPFVDPDFDPRWGKTEQLEEVATHVREGTDTEQERAHLRGLYQGEVRYVDAQVAELLEGLEARGLLQDATVIVVADHGEMFFESRSMPVGHGAEVDLFVTHVPLLFWGTGTHALSPDVRPELVAVSDLGPTMLALAGLPGELGDARDLTPLFAGGSVAPREVFMEATRPSAGHGPGWNNRRAEKGLAGDGHVVFRSRDSAPTTGPYRLDAEQTYVKDDAVREALDAKLQARIDQAPPFVDEEMSDDMREALQALGYMD